ncbi:MAG TPA: DsrE/DsrF/DrsH-like family protein [Roseiflexaceae bacterium]|nr:DsrE/DsrF/DrsH-like family protein [Roseiflexaceae bacterium]
MSKRMSLVVFSGTADKLTAVATLATGAAAMGMQVELFLTFWGLEAFRKGAKERPPRITAEFEDYGPVMMELMQVKRVPHWLDTIRDAREIGSVKVFACSATMELFDINLDDLEDVVDEVTGVATFIDRAKDADISMFI